jgi:hypothetical protein
MGASFCMQEGYTIPADTPLTLRYLLHAHRGPYDSAKAQSVHAAFASRPGFQITKSRKPHRQYEVQRHASSMISNPRPLPNSTSGSLTSP